MSSKKTPVISIVSLDFDNIVRMSDEEVYEHLVLVCRSSRKHIVPDRIRHDRFHISRTTEGIFVHLLLDQKETCRVGFVPAPPFRLDR